MTEEWRMGMPKYSRSYIHILYSRDLRDLTIYSLFILTGKGRVPNARKPLAQASAEVEDCLWS